MSGSKKRGRRGKGDDGDVTVAEPSRAVGAPPEPEVMAPPSARESRTGLATHEVGWPSEALKAEAPAQDRGTAANAPTPSVDPLSNFFVGLAERAAIDVSYVGEAADGTAPRGEIRELLAFWCADEQYGIDIGEIQEIIKVPSITEVPRAPAGVLGIISLRGVIVPIVDLRQVLRLEKRDLGREARIVVLRADGDPIGLLVDRISHVVRLDHETIEPPPSLGGMARADLVAGVGRVGEQILIVLDARLLWTVMEAAA